MSFSFSLNFAFRSSRAHLYFLLGIREKRRRRRRRRTVSQRSLTREMRASAFRDGQDRPFLNSKAVLLDICSCGKAARSFSCFAKEVKFPWQGKERMCRSFKKWRDSFLSTRSAGSRPNFFCSSSKKAEEEEEREAGKN